MTRSILVMLAVLGACGQAPAASDRLTRELEGLVTEGIMPGAVTLIVDDDEVVASSVVGVRDVAAGEPMTEDTIFRLYSMSKPITSVAIMMLVEEGKLTLDQAAHTVLPELADMRVYQSGADDDMVTVPASRPMTVEDLLLHQSGLTYHFTGTTPVHRYYRRHGVLRDTPVGRTPEDGEPARSLDELVARLGRAPMLHHPGETFAYSYSTTVLGAIIERVSGRRLDAFLDERIFQPLGMTDTGFFVDDEDVSRFVTNYMMTADGLTEIEAPETSDYRDRERLLDGGGALAGTARDYLRFVRMLANGGELDGVRLLSPDTVRAMFTGHTCIEGLGPTTAFGYGFAIAGDSPEDSRRMPPGSVGWSGSGNTFFWLEPGSGDAVVFMTQVITPPAFADVGQRFRDVVNRVAEALL